MRSTTIAAGVFAAVLVASPALAAGGAAADPALMAPIHGFIDSFNKGDVAAARAAHDPAGVSITDEPAPYLWTGPGAFDAWLKDLTADDAHDGVTDGAVTLGDPVRVEMSGDRAYVVVEAVYTFKQKGVAMREPARMTYVLQKGAGGWKIAAWTWTGPRATPAP